MARECDVRLHTRLATAAHHRIVVALRADKRRGRQGMCHVRERRPIQRHVSVIRVVQLEKAVRHTALGARPELELVARLVAHDALVTRRRAIALRLVHESERRLALEIRERLDTHRAGTRIVDALKVDRGTRWRHVHDLTRPRRTDAAHAVRGRSALQRIHTRLTHMNRMRAPRERPRRMHSLPVVVSVDVLDVPLIVPALVHLHGHTQREAITRPQQLQRATRHTLLGIPMHLRLRMHIRCGCLVQIRHIAAHIADMAQLQRMRAGRRHIERDRRRRARRVMHQRPLATRMRIRQRQRRRAVQHDLPLRLVAHTVVRRGRYKRRTRTLDERDGLRHNVRRLRLPIQHRLQAHKARLLQAQVVDRDRVAHVSCAAGRAARAPALRQRQRLGAVRHIRFGVRQLCIDTRFRVLDRMPRSVARRRIRDRVRERDRRRRLIQHDRNVHFAHALIQAHARTRDGRVDAGRAVRHDVHRMLAGNVGAWLHDMVETHAALTDTPYRWARRQCRDPHERLALQDRQHIQHRQEEEHHDVPSPPPASGRRGRRDASSHGRRTRRNREPVYAVAQRKVQEQRGKERRRLDAAP